MEIISDEIDLSSSYAVSDYRGLEYIWEAADNVNMSEQGVGPEHMSVGNKPMVNKSNPAVSRTLTDVTVSFRHTSHALGTIKAKELKVIQLEEDSKKWQIADGEVERLKSQLKPSPRFNL